MLSPLLTLARLWQIKEWRIDRLREHLHAEGPRTLLLGTTRPFLAAVVLTAAVATSWDMLALAGTAAFAGLSAIQFIVGKQPRPVWTSKAALIVLAALAGNLVAGLATRNHFAVAHPILLLLQPLFLAAGWLVILPLDLALRGRIFRKARKAREQYPNLTIIAVCGSVGKTTTKELLKTALNSIFPVATPAYVNSELGVAQWFLKEHAAKRIRPGGIVIMEMGGYRTGEVAMLCRIMKPTIGIVTSVGTQHIALYGSKENILRAEREMPSALPQDGLLILNGDNADCRALGDAARCTVVTVGTEDGRDVTAKDITETDTGLFLQADDRTISVPLHGRHNVTNVLCAYVAAKAAGLDGGEIASALAVASPVPHTFHTEERNGVLVLDDTHNSSPESVEAACTWAAKRPERPRVLLATGIIEQGNEEDATMERYGSLAATSFERVFFVGLRGKAAFERGLGRTTESVSQEPDQLQAGSLLAAVGRMPESLVDSLLP